ncbi:MAG TPA: glycosyltransferase family 2 protein [Bacteroidota bacterium]|nr:glycosyltransferase family 2 protein [Bacteroidota bacterium]
MAEETNDQQSQRPNPFRRKSFNRYRKPHGKQPRQDVPGEGAAVPSDEAHRDDESRLADETVPMGTRTNETATEPSEKIESVQPAAPLGTTPVEASRPTPAGPLQPPQQRRGGEGGQQRQRRQQPQQQQREPREPREHREPKEQQTSSGGGGGRTLVTVVIPLLNEEESLRELAEQLKNSLQRVTQNYEVIFIDDGSTDGSFKVLREINSRNRRMKAVRFRRNYGKSAAINVGFQKAQGEFVITMDADLQDDPAEIPNLLKELRAGYDVVSGWKKKRRDPFTKTVPSKFFNFVTGLTTGIKIHDFNCGLKGYKRDVVKSVDVYGELHRYIPALAHWLGFRIGEVVVNHRPRKFGKTKFGMGRFFRGFLDLLTLIFTTRFATRPLHLFGGWGIASTVIGVGTGAWLSYEKFVNGVPLSNRPLFLVSLILIILGVQFVSIGLLGELITKGQQSEKEYSIREEIR